MNNKVLWVVAGANGSGKTSLVLLYGSRFQDQITFINPDDIAKELDLNYDGRDASLIQKAGRETIVRQRKLIEEGESFGYETTFSSKRDLKIISHAQKLGYEIKLAFIGLKTSADNILRVEERVRKGGHYVSPKDITRRYERSISNLVKALDIADKIYIFDNSNTRQKLVCRIKNKKIVRQSNDLPSWIKDSKIATKLSAFEKPELKSTPQGENKKKGKNIHPSPSIDPFKKPWER